MIDALHEDELVDSPFGPHEEEAMISLFLDFPELYIPVAKYLTPNLFQGVASQWVSAALKHDFDANGIVPSRGLLRDRLAKSMTVEDPVDEVMGLVSRQSSPREVPILRKTLHSWAEHKIYDLLYSDEAIAAHHRGDHAILGKIFDDANRIKHTGEQGFWFFDQIDELFIDRALEHIGTGFPSLDKLLNGGGPSPKEVLIWLAPTGVGKCHSLESKIIEERLSRIFELEMDNNEIVRLAGFREVQTARGIIKVCDLTEKDDITSLPDMEDTGDIQLPDV
jgi:hypothetical protein